jgi:AcrR family transcriptional regulator
MVRDLPSVTTVEGFTSGQLGGGLTVTASVEARVDDGRAPAHRPSRRHVIVQAAIRVFAQKGFVEASIQDVADEASMVPTAVYYHFAGKDELFEVALSTVIAEIDLVVEEARDALGSVTEATLSSVIFAVWDWIETHPDEARVVYVHLPGATSQARQLSLEFEEQHVQRAFDYVQSTGKAGSARRQAADRARTTLAVRTMITLLMAIHPLRLEDGPLSKRSSEGLRRALEAVCSRIIGTASD